MSTKKSFREQEYLRRAQEILAENEAAKAQAQTAIEQTPQQKAAAARNNAYMKALNAFVAQSNMNAPDPVKNRAGEVLAYAMQGDTQQQSAANALVSGVGTAPTRGDVKNWDSNTARKAIIENETYMTLMRDMGMYDTPEYATNAQYSSLVSSGYLSSQLEDLTKQLEASKRKDKQVHNWQNWSDINNRIGEMTEYNAPYYWAYADYLLGNDTAPFSMDAYDTAWGNMTDEEFYAEQERLRTQFEGLDLAGLSQQPEEYASQSEGLETQLGIVQSEIGRRKQLDYLTGLASEVVANAAKNGQGDPSVYVSPFDYTYSEIDPNTVQGARKLSALMNDMGYYINNAEQLSYGQHGDIGTGNYWNPSYELYGYDFMTAQEIANYNALASIGLGDAYMKALEADLLRRRAMRQENKDTVYAQDPVYGTASAVGTVAAMPATSFLTLAGGIAGEENTNAPIYDMQRWTGTTRGVQGQLMGEMLSYDVLGQPIGTTVYNTLMSLGDMGMAYLTAGALSGGSANFAKAGMQFIMSSEAAAGTMYADLEKGFTADQALLHGIANGAVEAITERLPIDSLFSTDGKFLWRTIKSGLAEGGEEIASGVLQMGTDALVSYMAGKESEVQSVYREYARTMSHEEAALATMKHFAQDIALQGLSGFASGGMLGTVTHTINDSQARTTGKTAQQQGDVDTLITIAEGMGENSEAGKWAARLKARKQKGGRVSNYDVGRLTMALEQEVSTEMAEAPNQVMDEAIEGRLVELGETAENAKALAPVVRKTYRGQKVSGKEIKAVSWSDNAEQVVKELSRDTTAEDAGRAGVDWATQAKEGGAAAVEKATEKAATFAQAAGLRNKVVKGTQELQRVEGTLETSAAQAATKGTELAQNAGSKFKGGAPRKKAVSYVADDSTGQGELLRFVSDGGTMKAVVAEEQAGETTEKTVGLDQIDAAADEGVGAILAYVQDDGNQHHEMSEQEASTMLQVYAAEGGNAQAFIQGYEAAYLAGYAGIEVPTTTINSNAAEMAYKYGAQNAQADEANRSTRSGRRGTQGTGAVTWLGQVGSNSEVTGTGGDITSAMETMTESQRTTAEVVQALAQKLKIDVVLFESSAENIASTQNGSYQAGTNRIYIDINSGAASQQGVQTQKANGTLGYAMMKTLGHELTHYMESNSTEGYATYKQAIKNALKESGQDWATLVREKIDNAIRAGHKLTLAGAEAEVVADASEYMLQNSAFVQGLDNSVRGKVKQFIQSFMEKVRSIFANLTGGHRESEALRKTVDGVMQYTGNLQRLWDAGLRDATGRNYSENTTMRTSSTVQESASETEQTAEEELWTPEESVEDTAEEWTAEEATEEELWTPAEEAEAPAEQLAEEIYNEPAKAIAEERTVQDVIEEPTARELQQEAKATQKIAPEELIRGIENRFGIDIKVVDRAALLASYDPDSGTILIGKNASTGEVLYKALGMELMRHAQNSQYSEQLKTAVVLAAYEGNPDGYFADLRTVADEMNKRFDNYGKRKLTAESPIVQAELFPKLAAKVFGNESSMMHLIEKNFQKPTLLQRIHNALKGFVNKLRGLKSPALTPIQRAEHLLGQALKDVQRAAADPRKGKQLLKNFTDAHIKAVDRQTVVVRTTLLGDVDLELDGAQEGVPVDSLTPTTQFSMDRDVEVRTDGLMAVHNLKESDMEGTLALGGFPMPSIAIIKAKDGHTMYGEYSVIFGKQTIDPQKNKANKVYGADAWTPIFPRLETEIISDAMYDAEMEIEALANQVDKEFGKKARTFFGNFGGLDSTDMTMEDITDKAWVNPGLLAAYLTEQGVKVEVLEKEVDAERPYNPAKADQYDKILDAMDMNDYFNMPMHELLDKYGDKFAEASGQMSRLNAYWKTGDRRAGAAMARVLHEAIEYEGAGRDISEKKTKVKDYSATQTAMVSRVGRKAFNTWLADKLSGGLGAQGIYNGKDRFTPSGNRRTFKQTHDDVTASNVVKSMLTQEESNIPVTDAKGLMAAASSMYKSIAEIKADAGRLGKISDEEYNARIAKANNAHHDLLNEIEAWDYTKVEEVGNLLVQAAKKRMDAASITVMLKRNGYKATQKAGKMAADLIHQVQTIPSGYFEAKPARVVGFDEIKMVIAPDSMPESLAAQLDELGIPYTTYDGTDADRLEKSNAVEDAQFSTRDMPEETTVREYLADADDSMAATVEERNALEIYQKRLQAHEEATKAVEDAERAMKGADGEELKNARAALAKARAWQKEEYSKLIKLENTKHVQSVMQRTQQFISEEIAGKTSEDIAGMISEREQQIRQLEQDLEGLKGAARAQQEADIREQKRVVRALKNKATYKLEQKTEEFRAREQKAREYRRTRDEVNKLRRSIGRTIKRLNTLRVRETDQKHVPQEYQAVVDAVMRTFTDSSLSRLAFSAEKTASLQRTYKLLKEMESDMAYYWDDEIEADIELLTSLSEAYTAMRTREGGVPSTYSLEGVQLETEILRGVDAIVSNVMRMIDSANDAFIAGRTETFEQYASKTGDLLLKVKDAKRRSEFLKGLDELLRTGNMTPVYFIEHLNNPMIKSVFDQIRKGQSKYGKIVAEGQAFVQAAKKKYHYGRWVGDGSLRMKTSQGHTITLTREQAAWVYATAKREASNKLMQTEHLLKGGFEYKDIKTAGKDVLNKPHELDAADVAKIGEWLTAEQKSYADEMVGFLSSRMAEYGNQASMDMFGYKKFLEQYYFPFKTKADQRYLRGDEGASGEDAGTGRVKNSGFTKKLQHKANATLVMDDFTTVVTDHIQQMAMYSAMVEPIENLKRLLNYKVMEEDGTVQTVRALIGKKYGEPAQKYLTQLLKDLNGAAQGDTRAMDIVSKAVGAFKRGAVMASASVVLQQPTAMARAMAYVNPKYFLNNPFYRPSKGLWQKMMKYSGTAVIKDMGKFDVGLGMTASQYIADEHLGVFETYRRLKNESRTKAGKAAYDRFMDWLTAAPGLADQWTWGLIWQAVEKEQAALHPNMDHNSDEFLTTVGERFDDVVDHTQVYDSVLTRSNLMRAKGELHQMATSFMAEPTLSLNMLYDAMLGKHTPGQRAAIIGSVIASQVLAGAMAALVQAWNDDDDERNWLEKYAGRATSNILDNLNPLGMVPYIGNILDLVSGYEVNRPDMEVVNDIIQYGKKYFKAFEDGGQPSWKETENFIGALTNLVGIPYKNISREIRRTRNAVLNTDWGTPDMANVGKAIKENVSILGVITPWGGAKQDYYERMVTAMMQGNTEEVNDYRGYLIASKGSDEETITEGVRKAYKARYEEGGITKDEAVQFLLANDLVKGETPEKQRKKAFETVDEWDEGDAGGGAYVSIKAAVHRNDMETADQEIEELLSYGWTAKDVFGEMNSEVKKAYMAGEISKDAYKQFYNEHGIAAGEKAKDENDWYWVFKELDWGKSHGGSTEGYQMYGDLYSAVESGTNLKTTVSTYMKHGKDKDDLGEAITRKYKQQLIDLYQTNRAEFTRLQSRVLTAYAALGYDREQKRKTIEGWVK